MEKINVKFCLIILLVSVSNAFAQKESVIKEGLLSAQLTISTSSMFSEKQCFFYLHGGMEYFVSPKISLTGEGYYYLGNLSSEKSLFNYNHSLFFGASKHFIKNDNDLYIGFQPGIGFTKLNAVSNNLPATHMGVNPLASAVLGYNFYINNVFHFFVQSRLVVGEHNFDLNKNITELRFSAGLGLNLNTKKN